MSAKVLPFTGRMRTPREQTEASELNGIHVCRADGRWMLRQYQDGRIVEMRNLTREDLGRLVETVALALTTELP